MKGQFVMTSSLAVKIVAACAFGAAALYYLSTGKRDHNVNHLIMGAFCALLTAAIFAL
ncbi:MAG: hypothetical protein ABIJ96_05805 [Elusimicrobiota bacterium]